MNRPADGDGSGDPPTEPAQPDAAPPDEAAPPSTPPPQASTASLPAMVVVHYPDDGPLSAWLRRFDRALGAAEQAVLFVLLAAIVLTASAAALSEPLLDMHLGRWWFDVVRGGTFSVAMIGAVFASHQQRHLSMDLVSRRLPPRGRLILRVVLAVFTIAVVTLLVRSGLHQLDAAGDEGGDHLISDRTIVTFMPIGAVLIIVHTILHIAIDIDYLVRGKTPPERMRSGH